MATGQKNTYGPRRRFRGKTVMPNGMPRASALQQIKGKSINPREPAKNTCKGGIGGGKAPSYEMGQNQAYDTKTIPGQYKVQMPPNRYKMGGNATPIGA